MTIFFSPPSAEKTAKAALLTGSLAESGLVTKDVFHPRWLCCYLQEPATFPYLAPDKALCHSTVYHYQSQRIQGSFPLKWGAAEKQHFTYGNRKLCKIHSPLTLLARPRQGPVGSHFEIRTAFISHGVDSTRRWKHSSQNFGLYCHDRITRLLQISHSPDPPHPKGALLD